MCNSNNQRKRGYQFKSEWGERGMKAIKGKRLGRDWRKECEGGKGCNYILFKNVKTHIYTLASILILNH